MSRALTGIAILALLASGGGMRAQTTAPLPLRDRPPRTGTASISGRIVDGPTGTPLRRAGVRIIGAAIGGNRATATDGQGRYTFAGLPPGSFSLTAFKTGFVDWSYGQAIPFEQGKTIVVPDGEAVTRIDVALPHGAVITGRVLDEFGEPVADAQVMPLHIQYTPTGRRPVIAGRNGMTNDIGEFRLFGLPSGQYIVSAISRPQAMNPDLSDDHTGYARSYYPGTANLADAQILNVGTAQQISDVTVTLVPSQTARISGVVLNSQGQLRRDGLVGALTRGNGLAPAASSGSIRPDGTFVIAGLPPGDYVLLSTPDTPSSPGLQRETASALVTVNGTDIDGIQVVPLRQLTVGGRVVMDAATVQAFQPGQLRLSAFPLTADDQLLAGPRFPDPGSPVRADLSFEIKSYPGTMGIRSQNGWMIRSMTLNGVDVSDGVPFVNDDIDGLVIELTNRVPEIAGFATSGTGQRVDEYSVVVFPVDVNQWNALRDDRSALVRSAFGRYSVKALKPGNYHVGAVDHVQYTNWRNPEFLQSIVSRATSVSLADGETKDLDLRLIEVR